MLNSCSDPLVCTQETAAYLKKFRASQLRCAPGYRHNDITVLIIGNPNNDLYYYEITLYHFYGCDFNRPHMIGFIGGLP